MSKILVAMSGGVDSSVAALLLREAGHELIGATMRLVTNESMGIVGESTCCSTADVLDAAAVCDKLGIRHTSFDLDEEFVATVIRPFSESYAAGLTPNPCIWCNRYLKFDLLWRFAQQMGCDGIATGHYARIVHNESARRAELWRAKTLEKDQSYVLYPIVQEVLQHTYLPLGEFSSKEEVRALAAEHGFVTARKHESQDICFVPDGDYAAFLERFRGEPLTSGEIVDANGEIMGKHDGIERFTIGQRKGLDVSVGKRMYVLDKDPNTHRLVIGTAEELAQPGFRVAEANWLDGVMPDTMFEATAVVCYNGTHHPARLTPLSESTFEVTGIEPFSYVAPGQSCVIYDGDRVVAGGIISAS